MKKLLCTLLALCMLFGCSVAALASDGDAFTPVLRFVACSDTHVRTDSDTNVNRIRAMLRIAYDLADSDPVYNRLDALLIAGDLTHHGYRGEFDALKTVLGESLRDDTQLLAVVAQNHDGYSLPRREIRSICADLTGNGADFHVVINGYHFIGVSASSFALAHYDAGQMKWLKTQLDAAAADDANRPVFVAQHEHILGTVYGSSLYDGWGVPYFTSLLKNYPQVVDFSGHSHYPLNHPRSVWQGNFTAIGTGAVKSSEFTVDSTRVYHPEDSYDTTSCWIVEVDAAHTVRLRGFDIGAGQQLCELRLQNPADPANRDYTPEKRAAASSAPAFDENASALVTPDFGACTLTVPAAQSTDGTPVVLYRATALSASGAVAAKCWTLPSYYRAVRQDTVDLTLKGLAKGDYTVTITAENAYGKQSEPITARVTVDGETGVRFVFWRIAQALLDLKDRIVNLFG